MSTSIDEYLETLTVEDFEVDPYPIYARLRQERPVAYVPALDLWLVTRFDDVIAVGNAPERFSAEQPGSPIDRSLGVPNILTSDGERHADLRRTLDGKFRPRTVSKYIKDLVGPIVEEQLTSLQGDVEVDLLERYFEPISVRCLAQVLGLGHVDADTLREWFYGLAEGAINYEDNPERNERAASTVAEADRTLVPLLSELMQHADDSVMSHMLWGQRDETPRDLEDVLPSLRVIILGGMQEPGHGAASTLYGLLSAPAQLAWVREEPATRVAAAVNEGLRWVSPIGTQAKRVLEETELAGVTLPRDARMVSVLSSANRDEQVFDDADSFDASRVVERTVPFGVGAHFCVGHAFAREQMTMALGSLLERYPDMRLSAQTPAPFRGWEFRAPRSLHVTLG